MKKRHKSIKATIQKPKTKLFRPAVFLSLVAGIMATVGIAYAGNALLHESAIKQSIQKFEPSQDELQLTADVESRHQELMPVKAKAVKSREEVKQLIAQSAGSNSAFVYDPWGRLAQITEPDGSVRQFVYIGDKIAEERDGSGAVTKSFFEWGQMIGSTKYFYNRDHLGSVREMLDTSGNVVASYGYDAYGQVTKLSGSGADSDFLYAGYFYHRPSKLYITAHRVYSPKLARWFSRDPIDEPTFAMTPMQPEVKEALTAGKISAYTSPGAPTNPNVIAVASASHDPMIQAHLAKMTFGGSEPTIKNGTNLYTYVNNNPVSYKDPSGLAASCPATNNDLKECYAKCVRVCSEIYGGGPGFSDCLTRCFKLCRGEY